MNKQRGLQLYIFCIGCLTVGALGAAVFLASRISPAQLLHSLPETAFFVVIGLLASRRRVLISESSYHVMGTSAQIATVIILPYPLAIIAIGLAKGLNELLLVVTKETRRWRAVIVNTGATLVANCAAGFAFTMLDGHRNLWSHNLHALFAFPALGAMAGLYPIVNILIIVGAITLTSEEAPQVVFTRLARGTFLPEMSLILVGILFAVLWYFSPVLSVFLIVPLVFSVRSFESVARLRKETVEAVLKLAESIDYRDTGTYEHSQRLADLTRRLAAALGLTPEHVGDIVLASRVHDLGKIGISNDILLKPGPLTPEERGLMEQHPVIGATILDSYTQFRSSVEVVRHHHERWDGRGYPDGLQGEEIPLGSRVIAVVDAFDSMTADRPYRSGMSVEAAVERLKASMGAQFDPRVCAAFIQLLIEEGTYTPAEPGPELRIVPRRTNVG